MSIRLSGGALLIAAALFSCPGTVHAIPDEDAKICQDLAKHIQQAGPSKQTAGGKLDALTNSKDGFISLAGGPSDTELQKRVENRLSEDDKASFGDPTWQPVDWQSFGDSAIAVAQVRDGGAFNCSTFRFFDLAGDGDAKAIDIRKGGSEYCPREDGSHAYVAVVGGKPTLVEDQDLGSIENVSLVVRDNGVWHPSCSLRIVWRPTYRLTKRSCDGALCGKFGEAALDIAGAFEPKRDLSTYWAKIPKVATPDAHKRRMESCLYEDETRCRARNGKAWSAPSDHWTILLDGHPTTIARLDEQTYTAVTGSTDADTVSAELSFVPAPDRRKNPGDIELDFRNGANLAPIDIAGTNYLARIANLPAPGSTAEVDRYQVGIYQADRSGLRLVAGFIVAQDRLPHPTIKQAPTAATNAH